MNQLNSIPSSAEIREPPQTFKGQLKYLGPGFILSASIVGSGELIATTTLGAKAGFVTFWVILLSCLVKVTLQLEFGKHAISSGETTMASFNRLPGPRWGQANWSVWTWLFLMIFKFFQAGGIVGGVALVLHIAFGGAPVQVWTWLVAISVALIVFRGYYTLIEKLSVIMIGLFTILTFASLGFLQATDYAITMDSIFSGLQFRLPVEMIVFAIAAFGITGVGGDEIMQYNYWLQEKGYARFVGPRDDSAAWNNRARGWIKVMYTDAILAMVVYTLVTAAFYLLGAAVLHARGEVPEGFAMIEMLSRIYTESLGAGAKTVFLLGAFIVLYSTLFAALAGWTRIFGDAFGQIGWIDFDNSDTRRKTIALFAFLFPAIWSTLFSFVKLPVLMVVIGGVATSAILLLVVFAAFHFKFKRLPESLKPNWVYDTAFWLSAIAITLVCVYGLYKVFLLLSAPATG